MHCHRLGGHETGHGTGGGHSRMPTLALRGSASRRGGRPHGLRPLPPRCFGVPTSPRCACDANDPWHGEWMAQQGRDAGCTSQQPLGSRRPQRYVSERPASTMWLRTPGPVFLERAHLHSCHLKERNDTVMVLHKVQPGAKRAGNFLVIELLQCPRLWVGRAHSRAGECRNHPKASCRRAMVHGATDAGCAWLVSLLVPRRWPSAAAR